MARTLPDDPFADDAEPVDAAPDDTLPARPRKGRGAIGNPAGRYERESKIAVDDGWSHAADPDSEGDGAATDEDSPPLPTTIGIDATRTIINRNDSPDVPFEQSINPYRGCEHGCIYCFARPSHAYFGLSSGLDFETKLFAKPNAATLLAEELRRPGYAPSPIALGTNTDPYQPIEREIRITRAILETLAAFNHPLTIVTKSALVARDVDILGPMAAKNLARVFVSVTTLDRDLARRLEPRAPTAARRLGAIAELARAGVPTGVMAAPMIPALNDAEMEAILAAARDAGAVSAGYTLLRLPYEIKDLFAEWLAVHAPLKAKHVLALVRGVRDGRLNDPEFGSRMRGSGPYAELIAKRFRLACQRLDLNKNRWSLDLAQFRPPPRPGDQLRLF
ncbi:MAG: PA0069 family radical SAM protein [Rhodospirillales bacterium]|nr:PA0069 family radical SAM protein [Rhodospirillales bacterium]